MELREESMRVFLASCIALILLGAGFGLVLDVGWPRADQAFTTEGVRLTNSGENLVGKDWYSSKHF
jgi:hypothetical protein